jgi:hypothetical protein
MVIANMEPFQAYTECMEYVRKAKTKKEFDEFSTKMAVHLKVLKDDEDGVGYQWVRNAWNYYRKLVVE